jgi:hypothetical protein
MIIKIETEEELNKLLNVLSREIVEANTYHRLSCNLAVDDKDNDRVFNASNTFWSLTIFALYDAKMIRLCRVYDQNNASLNLVNLLDTIKSNLHFFKEQNFRGRLHENAFVDSLAQTDRVPSLEELEVDIKYASSKNPLVKKLVVWRGNMIAHLNTKISLGKIEVLEDNPLSQSDIEELLNKSLEIYNRYSKLYRASSSSRYIMGHDDYKSLFKFAKLGLDKWDDSDLRE